MDDFPLDWNAHPIGLLIEALNSVHEFHYINLDHVSLLSQGCGPTQLLDVEWWWISSPPRGRSRFMYSQPIKTSVLTVPFHFFFHSCHWDPHRKCAPRSTRIRHWTGKRRPTRNENSRFSPKSSEKAGATIFLFSQLDAFLKNKWSIHTMISYCFFQRKGKLKSYATLSL